nr:hypothetical protein GCM10020093_073710 [Planobispora longispora]
MAMDNISTSWGKDHLRLRRLVGKAFTPRRVQAIKPRIVELTDQLIDALAATEPGEVVDLRESFAYPLPARLVADLIGMDETALAKTAVVIELMVDTTATPEQAAAVLAGWRGAMAEFIESKRRNPGEDIASDLIAARDEDGSRLSEPELADTIFAILGAGTETTINFLDKATTALLTHPEQREMVTSGRVSWKEVLEETLRAEAPLASLPCGSRPTTSSSTGSPSARASPSSSTTPGSGATRPCTTTPTPSTSPAPTRSTSPSGTARTTASGRASRA